VYLHSLPPTIEEITMTATLTADPAETAQTRFVEAGGLRFAYRRLGRRDGVPLLLLQHFTGTMDAWDPEVVNGLAAARPVILFDNAGVSRSSGITPDNVRDMAQHALAFIHALGLAQVDLLGFSLGGFVAQILAAEHPDLVRRVILAGTGPEGGEGIANLPQVLQQAQQHSPGELRLFLFFSQTAPGQAAGRAFIERQARRTVDRDPQSGEQTVGAQFQAIVAWGSGSSTDGAARLQRIAQPALVVNGKEDIMVPTGNSYQLFHHLPNARLVLYPDSGHGALFQYADLFVKEALALLDD
jgi:pimeloyl-ACP methyl ester carboxylesterase